MNFRIRAVFNRSVTIEIDNMDRYRMDSAVRVLLNGREVLTTDQNVFTLMDLQPDTEYTVEVQPAAETADGVGEGSSIESADPLQADEAAEQYTLSQGSSGPEPGSGLDNSDASSTSTVQRFRTRRESVLLNVRRFGAAGDGTTDDTGALQAAILACPAEGTVYVPAGKYLSRPLFLKSRMTLWLDEGAAILGDTDRSHYPILPGMTRADSEQVEDEYNLASWEGNPLDSFASLLTGIGVENVDIIGRGTVDGRAQNGDWWQDPKVKRTAWRPNLLFFNHCRNIRVQGIHIQNSPSWTVHPYYSDHIQFLNVTIRNPYHSPNTDGFDPECCTDVLLLGSTISVGDDCIAIKSGKRYMACCHFKRTENVTIRNCLLEQGHGSVTVGSEIAGGVSHVYVSQCIFSGTDRGLRVKTRRGRGARSVLDDIVIDNVTMDKVLMPVTVNMFYFCDPDGHSDYVQDQAAHPVDSSTPTIGHVTLQNADCTGINGCFLCAVGLPENPVEEIRIENVHASFLPAAERTPSQTVMMDHIEPMEGVGVYAKNVALLELRNVVLQGSKDTNPRTENVGRLVMDSTSFTEY